MRRVLVFVLFQLLGFDCLYISGHAAITPWLAVVALGVLSTLLGIGSWHVLFEMPVWGGHQQEQRWHRSWIEIPAAVYVISNLLCLIFSLIGSNLGYHGNGPYFFGGGLVAITVFELVWWSAGRSTGPKKGAQ